MARICWIIGSSILLICGVMHLHGTFFSTDLHPKDESIIAALKAANIQMDKNGLMWHLWIGFNAMFSIGLLFIGLVNLYLAAKYFTFLKATSLLLLLSIGATFFFVWIGYVYMINAFLFSMLVPFVLFTVSYILMLVKPSHSEKK